MPPGERHALSEQLFQKEVPRSPNCGKILLGLFLGLGFVVLLSSVPLTSRGDGQHLPVQDPANTMLMQPVGLRQSMQPASALPFNKPLTGHGPVSGQGLWRRPLLQQGTGLMPRSAALQGPVLRLGQGRGQVATRASAADQLAGAELTQLKNGYSSGAPVVAEKLWKGKVRSSLPCAVLDDHCVAMRQLISVRV